MNICWDIPTKKTWFSGILYLTLVLLPPLLSTGPCPCIGPCDPQGCNETCRRIRRAKDDLNGEGWENDHLGSSRIGKILSRIWWSEGWENGLFLFWGPKNYHFYPKASQIGTGKGWHIWLSSQVISRKYNNIIISIIGYYMIPSI